MKLSFRYKQVSSAIQRPMIPLQFQLEDGTPVTLTGILDSGSDVILIPKAITDSLGLIMGKKI